MSGITSDIDADGTNSISVRISKNFSMAKGAAALTIMLGHYAHIQNFWLVVTVGLLVFTISSGYFTWQRYHGDFSPLRFWRNKFSRLVPNLIVIQIFLLCLFLYEGRNGIWTLHTVLNFIGLNGFLNWFHISNQSPYGLGMWFLTLLLIFYAVYPLLERFYRRNGDALTVTTGGVLCLFILQQKIEYGHALWLTAAGYFVGLFFARRQLQLPVPVSVALTVLGTVGMVVSHFIFRFDGANFFFIIIIAGGGMLFLMEIDLPWQITRSGAWLSGILLEIYLLHPYLLITPTKMLAVNLALSVGIVIAVSAILAKMSRYLGKIFYPIKART